MCEDRHDRQVRFFGIHGQEKLRANSVVLVGNGGLGSHAAQQLSYLGIGSLLLIDQDVVDTTTLNRMVGGTESDVGRTKVEVVSRLIHSIDRSIDVEVCNKPLQSDEAFAFLRKADYVLGCVDNDFARYILLEYCSAFRKPYIDLASDIHTDGRVEYGGHICCSFFGNGCLCCAGLLHLDRAVHDDADAKNRQELYGIDRAMLDGTGPSVVTINGVIASLGVTELMLALTGIRQPILALQYYGSNQELRKRLSNGSESCLFCNQIWGSESLAGTHRFILESEAV